MKRLITFALMATCLVISCSKFDDSAIWDKLNDHENRIAYLEEVCKKMNNDIVNLQTLVTALETNDYIVNASPLATGDGYTFIFKSGKSVVIYNGKDGKDGTDGKDGIDGKDGVTPIISVMKDVDGVYYWTVNGEWLLVNGQKVKASSTDGKDGENGTNGVNGINGKDGITPKFKIEDEYWYVSYDNGQSWEKLGKATGEDGQNGSNGIDGDSIFSKIEQDEAFVYFYLANGTMITLSKHDADIIQFEDLRVKAICCKNWDTNNDGELSYSEAAAVETIGTTFTNNTNIISFTELEYFTGLMEIPKNAFSGCSSLWKVQIPKNVIFIENQAFYNCRAIYKMELPSGLLSIGQSAFANCEGIAYVDIPNTVAEIGGSAFSGCSGIRKITVPEGVVSIGSSAFYDCTGELYINCDLLDCGSGNSPMRYSDFSKVVIGENVTSIGDYYFYECESLTDVVISDKVTRIGSSAFLYCEALVNITLSENLTTIEGYAFQYCKSLTSITIPQNVTKIGIDSFKDCTSLKDVYCKPTTPPEINFGGSDVCIFPLNTNLSVYIPRDSYALYVNYKPAYSLYFSWSKYKSNYKPYDFV